MILYQLEPAKTSTEKTSDTDNRSRDIDNKPRDQNPSVTISYKIKFSLNQSVQFLTECVV